MMLSSWRKYPPSITQTVAGALSIDMKSAPMNDYCCIFIVVVFLPPPITAANFCVFLNAVTDFKRESPILQIRTCG